MTTLEILNLKCGGCAHTIRKGLLKIHGISEVTVNLEESIVTVNNNERPVLEAAKNSLAAMGYPEAGSANSIMHRAKSMVSCATGKMTNQNGDGIL